MIRRYTTEKTFISFVFVGIKEKSQFNVLSYYDFADGLLAKFYIVMRIGCRRNVLNYLDMMMGAEWTDFNVVVPIQCWKPS